MSDKELREHVYLIINEMASNNNDTVPNRIDQIITLIANATLDEAKEAVSKIEEDPIQNEDYFTDGKYKAIDAIEQLREGEG